jgi:hypothetical protein
MRPLPAASIWTLGITLWEICSTAETPFAKIFDHQVTILGKFISVK